jgi:hypothetical protein
MLPAILKLLTPTLIKTVIKYVTEDNELDIAVRDIKQRLEALEKNAHPKRRLICYQRGKHSKKCQLVE